jgi:hypothetical protein
MSAQRRRARFDADEAGRQLAEDLDHLTAPQLAPDHNIAVGIDTVRLEHGLGEINADRGSLHVDGTSWGVLRLAMNTLWHIRCRERAPSTQSKLHTGSRQLLSDCSIS